MLPARDVCALEMQRLPGSFETIEGPNGDRRANLHAGSALQENIQPGVASAARNTRDPLQAFIRLVRTGHDLWTSVGQTDAQTKTPPPEGSGVLF